MTVALAARTSQVAALVSTPFKKAPTPRTSQVAMLVSYAPPSAQKAQTTQIAGLVALQREVYTVPGTSQVVMLVAYKTGVPDQSRTRAWSFTLDGHTFYVLNLGPEGTFVYDTSTQQWAQFDTQGFGQWNLINGTMWGQSRIVGGDSITDQVWELNPSAVLDEGWRDIAHVVTGGIQTRSRIFHSVEALRITASVGQIDEVNGATFTLKYSDDNGKTWSDPFTIELTQGNYDDELAYRSLGAFMAPGRIFELSDSGGLIRIDGADVFVDGFDEDNNAPTQPNGS